MQSTEMTSLLFGILLLVLYYYHYSLAPAAWSQHYNKDEAQPNEQKLHAYYDEDEKGTFPERIIHNDD